MTISTETTTHDPFTDSGTAQGVTSRYSAETGILETT